MKLSLFLSLLLIICGCDTGSNDVERLLGQVRVLPFKSTDTNTDPAYAELTKRGLSVGNDLVNQITNTEPSADPRKAPHVTANYVLGDTAVFVLADILDSSIEAFVPSQIAAKMQTSGVAAYFEYVQTSQGRADVKERALQALRAKTKHGRGDVSEQTNKQRNENGDRASR